MRDSVRYQFAWLLVAAAPAFSQEQQGMISGSVHDATTRLPIEFANAMLFTQEDSTLVTGASTDADGTFMLNRIPPGAYRLQLQLIGYETRRVDNVVIRPPQWAVDLGKLVLRPTPLQMDAVEVQAEALSLTYQLDKKVINVSQQHTAISGTAVDVLEKVPAITVDVEGNVRLRGSSNFTVLIDGRPSVLEASEALQQIPATSIDNVEIITNPSAKYDPEGAAGIINVVLKRNQRDGRSGIANLNAGLGEKYGADVLYDDRSGSQHATLSVDFNHRQFTGDDREENRTTRAGLTSLIQSQGDSRRQDEALGVRGEYKLELCRKHLLGWSGRYGTRNSRRGADQTFTSWSAAQVTPAHDASISDRQRDRIFGATHLSYLYRFAPQGHELSAEVFYRRHEGEEATVNGLWSNGTTQVSGRRTTESGPSSNLRARIDYTRACSKQAKFEAGYQFDFDHSTDAIGSYEFDPAAGDYLYQPQFSNRTQYDEDTHSFYALYAGETSGWGYQAGVRAEYTGRDIRVAGTAESFTIGRWDFFPTLHLTRQFTAGQQAMASYTRRLDRPGGGELEPFLTWTDAYNVRVGNPALQPEFIDSYELGLQSPLGQSLVSFEAYYRKTHNRIERVRSVYADNVTLHSVTNLGREEALGSELAMNLDFSKRWGVQATGNLYRYRLSGELFGESLARTSFNWNARLSNTFKLGRTAQIQLDGLYHSPSISTQGRREGFFTANAAVKYELVSKLLSATLQLRDVFASAKNEYTAQGVDFYSYNYSTREAPLVMLNLKYNFNNYRPERARKPAEDDRNEDDF